MPRRRQAVKNHMVQKIKKDCFWYLPSPLTLSMSSSSGEVSYCSSECCSSSISVSFIFPSYLNIWFAIIIVSYWTLEHSWIIEHYKLLYFKFFYFFFICPIFRGLVWFLISLFLQDFMIFKPKRIHLTQYKSENFIFFTLTTISNNLIIVNNYALIKSHLIGGQFTQQENKRLKWVSSQGS